MLCLMFRDKKVDILSISSIFLAHKNTFRTLDNHKHILPGGLILVDIATYRV